MKRRAARVVQRVRQSFAARRASGRAARRGLGPPWLPGVGAASLLVVALALAASCDDESGVRPLRGGAGAQAGAGASAGAGGGGASGGAVGGSAGIGGMSVGGDSAGGSGGGSGGGAGAGQGGLGAGGGCDALRSCGAVCCPVGTGCVNDACPLPDLVVDAAALASSVLITARNIAPGACELVEGCVGAAGVRKLLAFETRTPNRGAGDVVLGAPAQNPLFEWSSCHLHYHFSGFARYALRDGNGQVVVEGRKQAFCLEDLAPEAPGAPPAKYDCAFQGISAGWVDSYVAGLPCQWLDITDVPPGSYELVVTVNPDAVLTESDYANDEAVVPVVLPGNSCPNGCRASDAACCAPSDPCGWAADGSCDCGARFVWDTGDCGACTALGCGLGNGCPGGCTPAGDPVCCASGDPCGLADDGVCACGGGESWDADDCQACTTPDPDCPPPVPACLGCPADPPNDPCCGAVDICARAGDGFCDCAGLAAWDAADCALCAGICP